MAAETDIYPVGPTIDNANRLRATQGLPAIGAADEPLTPEQQSLGAPEQPDEQKQAELEGHVNGWIESYNDLLLNEQFNQIKDKTAQKAVVDDLSANIESEVDALHDKGIPSFAITNIRSALDEQRKRSHAMIDAGDRPLTPQQINDELDKRHADLRDLPTGGKKEHAQAVYQAVSAALNSEKFKKGGHIAKHMGLRPDFVEKDGVILGSATGIEKELHKMANDEHWAITNAVDSGLRSAISLGAGVAGRRFQDMTVNLTTAYYDPTDPSEVATIAAYRDFEQEMKAKYNAKADMVGQFAGMVVGGGAVFNAVKRATNVVRSARIVSRAAQALNMTQKTWKTTGSLLTLGISAANLASSKHGTTFNPMEKGYLKDFALESVKLAMLHAVGAGTARLFSRSIVRAMAPTLQFNKWVGTGLGMSAAGATNWAGMRGMEVMEAAFGDSHKSFADQLRDDWLGQMDYETLKRKGMPIGKWGGEVGLGAAAGGVGAWKGASSYADVMEAYRVARARADAKYHSGEFGFEAHNYVITQIDDAYTKRMKPGQREAFLDDAERYRKIWNDSNGAGRDITDATEAYKTAESLRNSDSPLAATQADNSGDTSALIAQQKLMTALAKQKAKKKAAMEEKMLRGETPTEETNPSEPTTPAPHPIIAQIDGVVTAHASELAALGHPADLVLVTIPDESGGGGFQFNQKTGKIEYDPVRIEKVTIGMTPRQLAKYIRRGIAEEIIHAATEKYASESPENQAKLRAILGDAEAVAAAKKAYGENAFEKLNETQKAFEVARVLIQGPRALTEAAYRFFKDLLRWLAQKVKNLSPETKELLDGIKAKMEAHKSGKVESPAKQALKPVEHTQANEGTPKAQSVGSGMVDLLQNGVDTNVANEMNRVWTPETQALQAKADELELAAKSAPKGAEGDSQRKEATQARILADKAAASETAAGIWASGLAREKRTLERKAQNEGTNQSPEHLDLMRDYDRMIRDHRETADEEVDLKKRSDARNKASQKPKESEPKNEKAQSVPSVQKADPNLRLPEAEVAPAAPSPEPVTPAAAKPVEAERNLAPLTEAERSLAESLAKKYGMPVLPTVQAEGEIENLSRFSNMLERAADKSNDETELARILSAAKGRIDESRIANAVANNPHSSEATFSEAKANSERQKMAGDESIAYLDARRAELRKQRGLDAQPAAAPAAEQPAAQAPAPRATVRLTKAEVDEAIAVLLKAPVKAGGKPRVSLKTQAEEAWFRRGFEAANGQPGQPPPEQPPGVPAKEQKLHDAFASGWSHAQIKLREAATPSSPAPAATPLLPKPIIKALLRSGHEVVPAGPQQAGFRSLVMEKIGKPVPKSKAGLTAVTKALAEYLGVDMNDTVAGVEAKMREKLTDMLAAHDAPAAAPAPAAVTPQSQGGIFGYSWDQIRGKQQGATLAQAIRGAAVKPKATEADLKLLESKGAEWLYDNEKFGVIDRLGLPMERPSKKAEVKPPTPEKPKQTKGVTLKVQNPYSLAPENEKILTMKGDIIKLAAQPEHEFFIYKAPNSNYWRVVERKTGSGIAAKMQKTRAAAIESAEQSVAKVAPDEFTKILNDAEWRNAEKPSKKAEVKPKLPAQSFAEKVRAKIVPGAKVSVQLVRGAKLAHPAVVGDVFMDSNGKPESVSVTFDGGGGIKKGRTQTVPFGNVSLRPGVESRMLTNEQFEGMTPEEARKTRAAAKEFKKLVIEYPELGFYSGHLEAVAAGPQGEAAIKKARADAVVKAMTALGVHPDKADARDAVTQASLVEKLRELTKKPGMERRQYADFQEAKEEGDGEIKAGDLKYGETINIGGEEMRVTDIDKDGVVTLQDGEKFGTQEVHPDESLMIKDETPEPVTPKLRPGEKVGEMFQGDDQPFNLAGEQAIQEGQSISEKQAADTAAAEAKAKQDKEQGNLFGVATPRMGQELADKADALGIPLNTEQIKKLIADDPDTLRDVRARLDRETGQRGDSIHRTANPADSLRETSTKNAVVDEERAKLGLDPIMSAIRKSHPVVWDAAMRALERDPNAGEDLVNEINGKPRALTATEEAIILRHKIKVQTAFYKEMEVANDETADPQDRMSAKLFAARHLDTMNEIDHATRAAGTEWGRLGAFIQRIAREDYTLVSMLRKRSMATGERIEPGGAEYQFVEKLNKRIAELEAKATQDARNHAAELEQLRETAMEDAIQKMRSDGTPAQKKEREILARIAANMESAKENADAALREMGFGPVANAAGPSGNTIGTANPQDANTLDPKVLKLLSVGGANHLRKLGNDRAKWDEAMLSNYGPKVQPHLDAVWDVSQATLNDFIDGQAPKETRENTKKKILTDAEKQKRTLDSIRRKSATPDKVAPYLKQLAKQLVSQGVNDRWTLLTTMETMLKDILPDATRSEIRDSLADYGEGKYRKLSTDEVSVKMRRLRAQLQQEAKIEDMMRRGELPWAIGSERGEPDAETRTMIKEVNEIKKELGLEATNENQGKSARAAIKTRLRNEIEELEKFIKTRERMPQNKRTVEDDEETKQLRRDVRAKRAEYQEIVGVDTMAEEGRKLDAVNQSITKLEVQIASGELAAATGKPTADTAELAASKDRLRDLRKQAATIRLKNKTLDNPNWKDDLALKTWKTRAEKRLADLKDRTARGDFSKKVRKVMPMDTEALKTKAALEAAKLEFDQANYKAMKANDPWWVKVMDVAQKYRRWAVLTSVTVFEKLALAAAWRTFVFQPIEDATGSIIRHIPFIKQVAVMAPRHGQGFNTRIQLDGMINGFASGASEAATHLKKAGNLLTGSKALSWLFGEMDEAKRLTQTPIEALSGKRKVEPDTAWDIPGVLHAVVKDIPKMVEFHKSVAFRTKWYADRGVDVSDPLMQEKIQIESFQDAMRAIFMQDNAVLNKLNRFIRSLGEPDAKTGKVNKWSKVWQTAFKVEFPIVKIPTNIVAEAFEYVSGFPAGLLNVRRAIKDGITNLQPEHADMIMRQLKKGLVGNAILLTGFLLASNIGGYFQHGRKRDKDDVPAGGIRIGDTTVHERALHAPALLILQAGATIARVMNSRLHKSDEDEQGLGAGLVASAMGLADEIPFVKEAFNLSALRNPYQKSHWFGSKARSIVEPALMQWIAKLRDTDEEGNPIKRQADGFVDEMKMGIPGLRETLDVKQENVPHARSHHR